MKTQLARSAIWYAKHGWAIFPLRPGTKEPFGGIGVYQATPDATQVTAWWDRWPNANIALHCGGSRLLAIDIDSYNDTYQGNGPLQQSDMETLTSLTGGGGTHLLYHVQDGRRWGNAKGDMPAAIDIKAWGGYIVLPPSIHPNGNPYQWETGYRPDEIKPIPLPDAICRLLDAGRRAQRMPGPPDSMAVDLSLRMVNSVLESLDIPVLKTDVHETTGRKIIMKVCPFMPEEYKHGADKASFVIIAPDGHIGAGCLHERCRNRLHEERISGWQWLLRTNSAGYAEAPKDEAVRRPDTYVSHRTARR